MKVCSTYFPRSSLRSTTFFRPSTFLPTAKLPHLNNPAILFALRRSSSSKRDFQRPARQYRTMARSAGVDQLTKYVKDLSLSDIATKYPNCHPDINPFDFYRAHLANVLHGITGVDHKIIYPNLQWTSSLDKGDFSLAAPSLRLKGKKPDELAKEWIDKVRYNPTLLR